MPNPIDTVVRLLRIKIDNDLPLTYEEVSLLTGLSTKTLQNYKCNGLLEALPGSSHSKPLFTLAQVRQFVARHFSGEKVP